MKKFEISAYGVEEMNSQEMKSIDGGWFPLVIWGVKITAKMFLAACAKGFVAGGAIGTAVYVSQR